LENGDHLNQKAFHERYCAMPEDFRAELVEGIVLVPSRIKLPHGRQHAALMGCLYTYKAATQGIDAVDNLTTILGEQSEPQPDAALFILPQFGGRCRIVDDYLHGAPEWLGEIASSSEAYDLHEKYRDYERAGVLEYVVILVREQAIRGFVLREGRFEPLSPDDEGIYRSPVFPGLWINAIALMRDDAADVLATLQQGLQSPEHAAFVSRLKEQGLRQT
jgi:Uma2 family endonuclease